MISCLQKYTFVSRLFWIFISANKIIGFCTEDERITARIRPPHRNLPTQNGKIDTVAHASHLKSHKVQIKIYSKWCRNFIMRWLHFNQIVKFSKLSTASIYFEEFKWKKTKKMLPLLLWWLIRSQSHHLCVFVVCVHFVHHTSTCHQPICFDIAESSYIRLLIPLYFVY